MDAKQINLSSLSDDLRKEVKKCLKEGRTKLSQMPDSIRRRVMKEAYGDDALSQSDADDEWSKKHDYDQGGAKNWNEVYDILKTGKFEGDSTEGLGYSDLFPHQEVHNVLNHLEKSGVISGNYFTKPISRQTFMNLVKYTIKQDKNLINPSRLKDYTSLDSIAKMYGNYHYHYRIVNPKKRERYDNLPESAFMVIMPEEHLKYVKYPEGFEETLSYAGNSTVKLSADGSILPVQAEKSNSAFSKFLIKIGNYPVYNSSYRRENFDIGELGGRSPNTHMHESKTINLSSLSEGLRKEVKKHLKEGRMKVSQMPDGVRKRLIKESSSLSDKLSRIKAIQDELNSSSDWDKIGLLSNEQSDLVHSVGKEDPNLLLSDLGGEDWETFINVYKSDHGIKPYGQKWSFADVNRYYKNRPQDDDDVENTDGEHLPQDDSLYRDEEEYYSNMYKESKKSIKLSSLSEGLRAEVKKHLKEGRTKMSMLPPKIQQLVEAEAGKYKTTYREFLLSKIKKHVGRSGHELFNEKIFAISSRTQQRIVNGEGHKDGFFFHDEKDIDLNNTPLLVYNVYGDVGKITAVLYPSGYNRYMNTVAVDINIFSTDELKQLEQSLFNQSRNYGWG